MLPKPMFSVVIPVFNREREIRRAIESCLSQKDANLEVIVVDDASRDRSAEVVASYEGSGVRLIRHPVNLGSTPARSSGIRAAMGDWIIRLDSDDELIPGALKKARESVDELPESVGRIGLMYRYLDGRESPFPAPSGEILGYEGFLEWLENSELYDCLTITRRSALEAVPLPEGRLMEMLHHLDFAKRFGTVWLRSAGVIYHVNAGERQSRGVAGREEALQNATEIHLILNRHGEALQRFAPSFYRAQMRKLIVSLALAGERRRALEEAARQLRFFPFSILHWIALGFVFMGRGPLSRALNLKWWLVEERRKWICKPRKGSRLPGANPTGS